MAQSIGNNSSLSLPWDNSTRMELILYMAKLNFILIFVQSFLCLGGLCGNILALIVINKKSLGNTSSAVFITYMSIFDSIVLISHGAHLVRPRRNLFIHCSLTYFTDLFTFCANWVLVIITLERCVAVSSPFLAKRFCTVYSARYSVYILFIVSFIFFTSTFPIIYATDSNRKKCIISVHLDLIQRVYQTIILYGIPDLLLLSNIFTVYTLIRRRIQQNQQHENNEKLEMRVTDVNSNRKQRQLTIMLVSVNLAFYLFTTPAAILYIAEYSPSKHADIHTRKRRYLLSQISVILLQLPNATNFIFYCFAGQRFRQATAETFRTFSNRLQIFYHRYILCDKHYKHPATYQLQNMNSNNKTNRTSCPESVAAFRRRTSTI